MLYRHKPLLVQANRVSYGNFRQLMAMCGATETYSDDPKKSVTGFYLDAVEGQVRVDLSDWLVQGIEGDYYACRPALFEISYEAIRDVDGTPV